MRHLYELQNIVQYYENKKVLSIDNLKLNDNQIIGFFGPNGSGKSTLFSLLSFIDKPSSGNIFFNGIANNKIDLETKKDIVMVPQNPYLLKRTVFENVAYGLRLRNQTDNLEKKVNEALSIVGLENSFSTRKWSQLSGGEAQRVALAARLILKPKVLILDEPTSGVDTNSAQLIKEAILSAKQKWHTTILISSHDNYWLNNICDKKIALFQGSVVESGSVNLLFSPWEKDGKSNLVKVFSDGQKLIIKNSFDKKRDSVLMINSDYIQICRTDCEHIITEETLNGVVNSIHQQENEDLLLIEFFIGTILFNCKISRKDMKKQRLLPGDKIYVNISTEDIRWI
ncbi:energy-coupling factor ABC transporter ATP-binding protein [Arcobacter sp.]|uniref:energy-coupling factor ABC transporter ATP-binding protein n=1 Tax=Arcobacter sp. TaxID=1872629 RepID=UPI003C7602A0